MKTYLKYFAVGLIATSALVSSQAIAGSVLRLDVSPVGEIDPAKASDYADSMLMYNLYDALVIPKEGQPGYDPFLAESWTVDGSEYTFKLRNDVKFISGNTMSADDVVFSFDRMMALGQGMSHLYTLVDKVEAVDASTVKFTLKEPYSPFIAALTRLPIVDKADVMAHLEDGDGEMKDWGQAYLSGHTAGTGAYKIVSHNPQEETVMEKNADYFLSVPEAAPDTVRMRYGLEAATVRTLMAQGEHEISSQWLPPEVLKSLSKSGMQLLTERGSSEFYIKLNTAKPPFDDVECRRAVSYAFDYDTAVKMVSITDDVAQGSPSTGALPVGMMGALPASEEIHQDLAKAKEHLALCKYDLKNMDIELSWIGEVPLEERFALLMQANFTQLGIKATVKKVPWALFVDRVSKPENTPNISQVFVNTTTGDPDSLIYAMYDSKHSGTWMAPEYLKDEKVDALLAKGRAVSDEAERIKVYAELNNYLKDIAPTIYGMDQIAVFAATNKVSVPALSDPSKAFALAGFGFNFRMMEMKD